MLGVFLCLWVESFVLCLCCLSLRVSELELLSRDMGQEQGMDRNSPPNFKVVKCKGWKSLSYWDAFWDRGRIFLPGSSAKRAVKGAPCTPNKKLPSWDGTNWAGSAAVVRNTIVAVVLPPADDQLVPQPILSLSTGGRDAQGTICHCATVQRSVTRSVPLIHTEPVDYPPPPAPQSCHPLSPFILSHQVEP